MRSILDVPAALDPPLPLTLNNKTLYSYRYAFSPGIYFDITCQTIDLVKRHCNETLGARFVVCQSFNQKVV